MAQCTLCMEGQAAVVMEIPSTEALPGPADTGGGAECFRGPEDGPLAHADHCLTHSW